VALAYQGVQWALRERVKNLTCLYGVGALTQRPDLSQDALLQGAAELLPPSWQYPEITGASITLHGRAYRTAGFRESPFRQSTPLVVDGEVSGLVEVVYTEERPLSDEGPFLAEERALIDAVAELLGASLTRRRTRWALGERVKEMTCLYGIATLAQKPFGPASCSRASRNSFPPRGTTPRRPRPASLWTATSARRRASGPRDSA
jgi:hypothetical protein